MPLPLAAAPPAGSRPRRFGRGPDQATSAYHLILTRESKRGYGVIPTKEGSRLIHTNVRALIEPSHQPASALARNATLKPALNDFSNSPARPLDRARMSVYSVRTVPRGRANAELPPDAK